MAKTLLVLFRMNNNVTKIVARRKLYLKKITERESVSGFGHASVVRFLRLALETEERTKR